MVVRSSKYRHVYGDSTRKDKCIDNIRLTKNAFDANLAKSNGKYVSLNWEASGGGSFAVIPTSEQCKLRDRFPLFDGHKGPVLDTDWNPFDDEMVVSASDDGTIGIWKVPENFSVQEDFGGCLDDCKDIEPIKFLTGHGKKVGHVGFNPIAKDILASCSLDNTIKVWNIETGKVLFTLQHPSFVTSFSWNYDGTKIASVAKDRILRVWNVRKEKIISEGKGHAGAKGSRVVWLGDRERVLTTGFSLVSDREMAIWNAEDIPAGPVGGFRGLDPSSGIVIPHYDPMTSMVYLGGRGDGKIVYFEYADDTLYDLFAYNSTFPQRGLGWAPNRSLDPHSHEVARVYKVHEGLIEPISFKVPLKNEGFLDNVYDIVEAGKPALTAEEWALGKAARPLVYEWRDVYEGEPGEAKPAPKTAASEPESKADTKSEPKANTEPKATTETKEPEKTETKTETKTAPREESKTSSNVEKKTEPVKKEDIHPQDKAEKQDSYDVLQSKGVKSFLAKNAEEEGPEPESEWSAEEIKATSSIEPKEETTGISVKSSLFSNGVKKEEPKKTESKKEESWKIPDSTSIIDSEAKVLQKEIKNANTSDKLDEILKKLDSLSARIEKLESK